MPIVSRLAPEFAATVRSLPVRDLADLARARAIFLDLKARLPAPPPDPSVAHADHRAPGRDGQPDVPVRLFRPRDATGDLPCVYWVQGGGYVLPSVDLDDQWCESIASSLGCVVIAVEWRRAPEHPFPAAVEDSYTGLKWAVDNAAGLELDVTRVVIAGESSGGGTAAGLALLVRDRAEFAVCHQLLIQPMLDDTNSTPSSYAVTDPVVWNRASNEIAWRAYLGDAYGTNRVSPYAAPARMLDVSGVAPATILTSELDLFVDENLAYAQRLLDASVSTELHVYPGVPHGFYRLMPKESVSRQLLAARDASLRRAFAAVREPAADAR
jgi:acetyl esterase/lipase